MDYPQDDPDRIKATCTSCGHVEHMFSWFWKGDNTCLECDGKLRREGEQLPPSEVTNKMRQLYMKRHKDGNKI